MTATREQFQAAVARISRLPGKRWGPEAKRWLGEHGYRTGADVVAIVVDAADTYRVQGYYTPIGHPLAGKESRHALNERIGRVLAWLDAEVTPEMVAEYEADAIKDFGSVEKALALDEASMRAEGAAVDLLQKAEAAGIAVPLARLRRPPVATLTHGSNADCPKVRSGEWPYCRGHADE